SDWSDRSLPAAARGCKPWRGFIDLQGMARWMLLLPLVAACAASGARGDALSPQEFEQALERGRALERSAPELDANLSGGRYRWMRVSATQGPRVHEATDVSILVLSGFVRVSTSE